MLGLENTHPPHCSPEIYGLVIAGSWRINGVGNYLEDWAAGKCNVNGALYHISEWF